MAEAGDRPKKKKRRKEEEKKEEKNRREKNCSSEVFWEQETIFSYFLFLF